MFSLPDLQLLSNFDKMSSSDIFLQTGDWYLLTSDICPLENFHNDFNHQMQVNLVFLLLEAEARALCMFPGRQKFVSYFEMKKKAV